MENTPYGENTRATPHENDVGRSCKMVHGVCGVYEYDADGNLVRYSGAPPIIVEAIKDKVDK
jgi:hypothetical protein